MSEPTRSGIQIIAAHDAAGSAALLAERIRGQLLVGAEATRRVLAERMRPLRPAVGDAQIEELRRLATELREMATEVPQPAPPPVVEVDHEAIRDAASLVIELELELVRLKEQCAARDIAIATEEARAAEQERADSYAAENRKRRRVAATTFVIFIVLGAVLSRTEAGGLPAILAVVLGGLLVLRSNERHQELLDLRDEEEAQDAPPIDDNPPPEPEMDEDIRAATERLLSAQEHWTQLAGDADPHDIDALLHVEEPPPPPAVDSRQRHAEARWRVAWTALGIDDPPAVDDLEAWLATATREEEAPSFAHGPLVLVEPGDWLSADLLYQVQQIARTNDVYFVVEKT